MKRGLNDVYHKQFKRIRQSCRGNFLATSVFINRKNDYPTKECQPSEDTINLAGLK